jgi:uncharacterized protein
MISEQEFADGKNEGDFIDYYPNGNIKEEKAYEDDQLHGFWIVYDQNEVITKKVKYFRGEIIPQIDS